MEHMTVALWVDSIGAICIAGVNDPQQTASFSHLAPRSGQRAQVHM